MGGDHTRRSVLAGAVSAGAAVLGGCGAGQGARPLDVLAAGSLAVPFEETVGPRFEAATGAHVRGEYRGSAALLRLVADGHRRPDVVVSADASLLRAVLPPAVARWDAVFASNALAVTAAPGTAAAARLAAGEPWYAVLRDEGGVRSDPDLDPLGYRTVMLFDLAADRHGVDGLAAALRASLRVDPSETHLLAAVEAGDAPAAVCYGSMATDRGLPVVDLPDALDFSDPAFADAYARASYTTEGGRTVRGRPVLYAATVPDGARQPGAGRRFVRFLSSNPGLLRDHGLAVPASLPRAHGQAPDGVVP